MDGLLLAMRGVARRGRRWVGSRRAGRVTKPLTPAELKIGDMIGRGLEPQRIATELGISLATVRCHIQHIAEKIHNPDQLKPLTLILLTFAHKRWLALHDEAA